MTYAEVEQEDDRLLDVGVAVGLSLVGMGVGVAASIAAVLLITVSGVELGDDIANIVLLLSLQIVGLAGTAGVYLRSTDRGLDFVRLRTPTLRHIAAGVGGFLMLIVPVVVVSVIMTAIGQEAAEHSTVEQIDPAQGGNPMFALYMIPLSILVIGPCEEFLFRGVIQTRLKDSFDTMEAVLVTSAIFSLVHVPAYGAGSLSGEITLGDVQSLATTLFILLGLALVLGWVYERTENLIVPMISHGLYNATLFGILYITVTYSDTIEGMTETTSAVVGLV